MSLQRLAGFSLLGGVILAFLLGWFAWFMGVTGAFVALGAFAGLAIGTPISAVAIYLFQK